MKLGIDIGAGNLACAVVDGDRLVWQDHAAHNGNVEDTLSRMLARARDAVGEIRHMGITGSMEPEGLAVIDPIIASVEANRFLNTGCRHILSIGCETFYLIHLDETLAYQGHVVNSDCASGTGSFLDQQAERLGFSTAELARKAAEFKGSAPSIATRCAVFAKSDIIHAQAKGFSKEAICRGLCRGIARSVLARTVKGRSLEGNVLFVGGVAQNRDIATAVSDLLGKPVQTNDTGPCFNAVGAAVLGTIPFDTTIAVRRPGAGGGQARKTLDVNPAHYPDFEQDETVIRDDIEITRYQPPDATEVPVYIGIDVGSTSTKAIVTDTDLRVLAGLYARTQGDPVRAVTRLLRQVRDLFRDRVLEIRGVATTGSGRDLVRDIVGADLAVNEITAHARGAAFLDPETDTIIEIGGQDSKFTLLRDGNVTHSVMNYVCAAGTGSFIEEQAKRLSMGLDEIAGAVAGQTAPYTSDRCTVYMERDLNIFLSRGWTREQIMAAVLYSVRDNYLSKVVGKSRPGRRIWFQGATARNKALVAVFEKELGQPVRVSRFCHLTGALGCAVILKEKGIRESRFAGMDLQYTLASEVCTLCHNECDLRVYTVNGRKTAWGLKCGRDYDDNRAGRGSGRSGLETAFRSCFKVPRPADTGDGAGTVGIPETLFMTEYGSLFADFFQRLGFRVRLEKSSEKALETGMKTINAEFCAPMALAHGLVASLVEKDTDFIFLPTLINGRGMTDPLPSEPLFREKSLDAYLCYYSACAGTLINHLPNLDLGGRLLTPAIRFNHRSDGQVADDLALSLSGVLDLAPDRIAAAFMAAKQGFDSRRAAWREEGRKRLSRHPERMKILLLGRPYAVFDARMNLKIPAAWEAMGFDLIHQSMLAPDPETVDLPHLPAMHWYFGQQMLLALDSVRRHPGVYPVFMTCFRCSPDAYLINYVKDIMEDLDKPYLILQLDEHANDAGYLTRMEAAADAMQNHFNRIRTNPDLPATAGRVSGKQTRGNALADGDTVLVPLTDRRINRFQQAVFEAAGFRARLVDLDTEMLNQGYRYATGGECLPNVAIAGSVIHLLQTGDVDPEKSVLYLPNICLSCNFNQYGELVRLACDKAGIHGFRVMDANGLGPVPGLPARANAMLLSAVVLGGILSKLRFRFQPYEREPGSVRAAVARSETIILETIRQRKSLVSAAKQIRDVFGDFQLPRDRKPRIGILGDLYAKYNTVLNQAICDHAEALGGEILLPSYNELVLHAMHADVVEQGRGRRLLDTMVRHEQQLESVFHGLLDGLEEPPPDACWDLMKRFGFTEFIAGETAVSIGRMLYYVEHGLVDAVIHVNPVFCCPGVISSSLFRKIQETSGIPVIDLFYDGTNSPNKMVDPHLFYLTRN